MAGSWVRTITTPFRKVGTLFNNNNNTTQNQQNQRDKNRSQQGGHIDNNHVIDLLHGEVMACAYDDVQVMWSMLDKSNQLRICNVN